MSPESSIVDRDSPVIRSWLALAAVLLVCLPPLLIDLGERPSTHTMENVALVVSQETWLRWHGGDDRALWITFNDGLPRVQKPPMAAWLNFLAWSDLDPTTATPVELTYRARLVSVVLGLIMLGSIFWMGCTLEDAKLAIVATLAAGTMWFFQRQARWASYDIHFVAWATLSVASGLWAMKAAFRSTDRNPALWRPLSGWALCGLTMAVSVMSKNPLSLALTVLPLAGAVLLIPTRRRAAGLGLLAALSLALLLTVPWYVYVATVFPDATSVLRHEFSQPRDEPQPLYYYLGLIGLVAPWPIWLVCGLLQPFDAANARDRRRRLLIAWCWFAIILVLFSIPGAKQQRYILPIIPAAALLIGQVIRDHQAKAEAGVLDDLGRKIGNIMWFVIALATVVLVAFMFAHDWFVARFPHQFATRVVEPLGPIGAALLAAVMLGIVAVGWRLHAQWRPLPAAIAMGAWTIVATTVFWSRYSAPPTKVDEIKHSAEKLAAIVGGAPVRSLRITRADDRTYILNEEFRLYFGRLIPRIHADELVGLAVDTPGAAYVLTEQGDEYSQALELASFSRISEIITDTNEVQELWKHGND